jgi:hypothetical protein
MLLAASERSRRRILALSFALILSACSGDGRGEEGGSGETDQADRSSATEQANGTRQVQQAIEPVAQEHAESIVLTRSDLPDGWQPHEGGVGVTGACLGGDYSALTLTGIAGGDVFQDDKEGEGRVGSGGQVFATEEMAAELLEILADEVERDEVEQCVIDQLGQDPAAPEIGANIREISVPPPSGVDDARAWQTTITYDEEPFTAYDQMVVLRDGDTVASVVTWSFLRPFNSVLRGEMIATVASRMPD